MAPAHRRLAPLPVALILLAGGCGDSTEPLVPTSLELDHHTLALEVDETAEVTARILDQHGNAVAEPPEGFDLTWSTSDPEVARVEEGTITAVAPGTATITARAGSLPPVQVQVEVASFELSGEISFDYSGDRSGTLEISATFRMTPDQGPDSSDWVVTFFDSDFGSQDILGEREASSGVFDGLWFWVLGQVTEEVTRDADDGFIVFGFDTATGTWDRLYTVTGGSVTFSSVTESRMSGTFELTLADDAGNVLNVTDGAFDVPLVTAEQLGAGEASPPSGLSAPREGPRSPGGR